MRTLTLLALLTLGVAGPCGPAPFDKCIQVGDSTICGWYCTESSVNIILNGSGECVDINR